MTVSRFGEFVIDPARGNLRRGAVDVALRPKTWRLLCYLAASPGVLIEKDELIAAVWPDAIASDDSLVHCVAEIRRALGDDHGTLLRTVPGRGYRFDAPVAPMPDDHGRSPAERDHRVPELQNTAEAWRLLLRIPGRESIVAARLRFERELQLEDRNVDALTGIALSHVIEVLNRWSSAPAWQVSLAKEAADRALGLGRRSALAHHARAHVAHLEGCHFEALAGYRRALELDPSLARAQLRIGVIEMELGRAQTTAGHVRAALGRRMRDPALASQACFIEGMAAFHLRRDKEALAAMRRCLYFNDAAALAHQWLAAIEALRGRESAAANHLERFRRSAPSHTLESLRSTERSWNPVFRAQRERFYEGLRRAGLP